MRCVVPFLLCLVAAATPGAGISIRHDAVGCVVAERFPELEAQFEPAERLARARLHFRPEGGRYWYSVAMTREGDRFRAVMPKPRRSLKGFSYYIEATDLEFAASRTREYAPRVVAVPAECEPMLLAAAASAASVLVEAPAGAPAVPAGFAASGVTTVSATAAAVGAVAGGTGTSLGLVVGVVGGAAAVAGVAVAAGGGGGTTSSTSTTPSPPAVTPTPAPTPLPPPLDLTGQWVGTSPDGFRHTAGRCAGEEDDISSLTLTQSGSNVAGTFQGQVRLAASDVTCPPVGLRSSGTLTGSISSGTISATVAYTEPPASTPKSITSTTVTSTRMTGTWMTLGGGQGAGTWSANRQ